MKQEKGIALTNALPAEAVDFHKRCMEFAAALDTPPSAAEIKINKYADNSKYVPIQVIENKLNYFFSGLWQVRNVESKVIVNEIAVTLEVGVFHPILREWIWRAGAGATQIQLRAEYVTDDKGNKRKKPTDILDVGRKIQNTLSKDFPHAKAEALKNAAKSFGRSFGSALNRDIEDQISPLDNLREIEDILQQLAELQSYEELVQAFQALPAMQQKDKRIVNLFNQRKNKLK